MDYWYESIPVHDHARAYCASLAVRLGCTWEGAASVLLCRGVATDAEAREDYETARRARAEAIAALEYSRGLVDTLPAFNALGEAIS